MIQYIEKYSVPLVNTKPGTDNVFNTGVFHVVSHLGFCTGHHSICFAFSLLTVKRMLTLNELTVFPNHI